MSGGKIVLLFWILILAQFLVYISFEKKNLLIGPGFSFLFIWTSIIICSFLSISKLSRSLSEESFIFFSMVFLFYFFGYVLALLKRSAFEEYEVNMRITVKKTFLIFGIIGLLNVWASGYIPLINLIKGMDSLYKDFGIPTVNGFFYAYANFISVYFFYCFMKTSKFKFLGYIFSISFVMLLFMTRQNIITIFIECGIMYFIYKYNFKRVFKFFFICMLILYGFSVVGELRSGNIYEIAEIPFEYQWIPRLIIWMYSYSVYNLINLDNLILLNLEPLYDFSSLSSLIPSVLRPDKIHSINYLEKVNFNVSTYLSGIYMDFGMAGVCTFSFLQGYLVNYYYLKMRKDDYAKISFSVIYTCNILSFFSNMFLYLPVIGQLLFSMFLLQGKHGGSSYEK